METYLQPVIFLLSTPVRNPALCQTAFKGMRDNFGMLMVLNINATDSYCKYLGKTVV